MNITRWTMAATAATLVLAGCGIDAQRDQREGGGRSSEGLAGEAAAMTRLVDADTFAVGDRRIRVLGINSCESDTPGGKRATADAADLLDGPMVLTREPGVDVDRYGRELRYVTVGGQDYGATMVARDHTEVYRGRNDASPEYVAKLRGLDSDGRNCDR